MDTSQEFSPLLRWAGSKRSHLTKLLSQVPSAFSRYVEPFAGSASFFFKLRPSAALLGDLNAELMETYRSVRAAPEAVHRALVSFPVGPESYYAIRDGWSPATPHEKAARFIYLNRFCFNGLYRTNRAGKFNVPFGRPKNSNVPTLDQITACAEALATAELVAADFREVLKQIRRDDFVYMDPPYATSSRRTFVEYQRDAFSPKDLNDVAHSLHHIDEAGAVFLLSYAFTSEAKKVFGSWTQKKIAVRRNVAGFAGARRTQYELLVSNRPLVRWKT